MKIVTKKVEGWSLVRPFDFDLLTCFFKDLIAEAFLDASLHILSTSAPRYHNEKIKVSDLAKELNMTNKELLEILSKLEIHAKAHNSSISNADKEKVKKYLEG